MNTRRFFSSSPGPVNDRAYSGFGGCAGAIAPPAPDSGSPCHPPRLSLPPQTAPAIPAPAAPRSGPRPPAPATPPPAAQAPGDAGACSGADRRPVRRRDHLDPGKTAVVLKGSANWGFGIPKTLIDSFKKVQALLDKQGIKAVRQFDDRLHLDRRQRLLPSRPKFLSTRSRRISPRTSASARRPTARR